MSQLRAKSARRSPLIDSIGRPKKPIRVLVNKNLNEAKNQNAKTQSALEDERRPKTGRQENLKRLFVSSRKS